MNHDGPCPHCATPVQASDRNAPFCCRGCAEVYRLLHSEGLDRYYDLAGKAVVPVNEQGSERSLAWLEPILAPTQEQGGQVCSVELDVQGIHCSACVWLMNELYLRKPGASAITVNPAIGKVRLAWERGSVDIAEFVKEVERFGYRFGPSRKKMDPQSRSIALRIGISVALSMNVMMFSTSFYTGLSPADGQLYTLFGRLAMGLTTLVVLIGGWPFFKSSWEGLRKGMLHLDIPIAMGIALAYITSVVQTRGGQGELAYFDTLAIFVTLMLVGRWLQQRVLDRNRAHLLEDDGIDGLVVRRQRDHRLDVVPAAEVKEGDILLLSPGDLVPMDCELLDSEVALSTDWINGESEPQLLHRGDTLPAGGFNAGQTAVRMKALETLLQSPLPSLLRAGTDRGNMRQGRLMDGIARWYVPAVLFIATSGFLLWLPVSTKAALDVTVALLVVTCPCALGLALPLGLELALAHLRRSGVFVRSGDLFDRALKVSKVLFDKTGTLTLGRLELVDPSVLDTLSSDERNTLYALSARSNHPVSRSISEELGERSDVRFASQEMIREFPGMGVELESGGRRFRLGRPTWALSPLSEDISSHSMNPPSQHQEGLSAQENGDANTAQETVRNQTAALNRGANRNQEADRNQISNRNQEAATYQTAVLGRSADRNQEAAPYRTAALSRGADPSRLADPNRLADLDQLADQDQLADRNQLADRDPQSNPNQLADRNQGTDQNQLAARNQGADRNQEASLTREASSNQREELPQLELTGLRDSPESSPPAPSQQGTVFSVDGKAIASFQTQESMREDARQEIQKLKDRGLQVWLISGDASPKVAAAAQSLGIPAERTLAEQSPEQKAEAVAKLDRNDTLFVGDGVNDSLAFAAAHTTASPAVDRPAMPGKSDFFLLGSGIGGISRLLQVTQAWRRTARRILLIALTYNALVITASYLGLMTPLRAAIAMPISSVVVILFTVLSLSHKRLSRLNGSLPTPASTANAGQRGREEMSRPTDGTRGTGILGVRTSTAEVNP